tara:strand:- start:1578 stop:2429 length:852 start_codon:yes stop_codon:yes gene_type:complete
MALTFHTFKFLEKLKKNNLNFGETLTIGRLNNLLEKEDFKLLNIQIDQNVYADKLLKQHFNLLSLNALDYSSFEDADIIHDLNIPLENSNKQFNTIIDFGTSEHVFNVTECLKNISNLCKINGHIVHCLPANNNCGHGFWQFSPELFFNIYDNTNGFDETEIFLINLFDKKNWYKINKQKIGERLELNSKEPLYLLVKTKKIGKNLYQNINQSDYEQQWLNDQYPTVFKKKRLSLINKRIKDLFKFFLRSNIITKSFYKNLEKTKLHNKNNYKVNKNLVKLRI